MVDIKGIIPVVITPFDESGAVDEQSLRTHIRYLLSEGVHGIIPTGSTGEFAALTEEEHKKVIDVTVDEVGGQVPVIAGTASVSTAQTIKMTQYAQAAGADAVMVVAPYYCHPDEDEIYGHFKALAEAVDITIVLYNNPGTSGVDMSPELVARLATFPNVNYIKESTGDMTRLMEISRLCGDDMKVLCGCDTLSMEMFLLGAVGWVTPPANLIPSLCVELYNKAAVDRDVEAAKSLYLRLLPLFSLFEGTGKYVQLTKAGLNSLGWSVGNPRLPLLPCSDTHVIELKRVLEPLVS